MTSRRPSASPKHPLLRLLFLVAFLIPLLSLPLPAKDTLAAALDLTWTQKAALHTPRLGLGLASINNKLYAIGGWNGDNIAVTEEYDPATNTWSARASMPTRRRQFGIATAPSGKIYVMGGLGPCNCPINSVEEYDPSTNTWATKSPMPTSRYGLGAALGSTGKIYAIGGYNGAFLTTVEEYDPGTNTWTSKAPMPTGRVELSVIAANAGTIYAVGGSTFTEVLTATVEEYNPATNTWSPRTAMPQARHRMAAANGPSDRLYFMGGQGPEASGTEVLEYDPASDSWSSKQSMSIVRQRAAAAQGADGKLYVTGGADGGDQVVDQAVTEAGAFALPAVVAIHSGNNQSGNPLAPLAAPLVVKVTDTDGNPVADVPIAWRVSGMPAGAIRQSFTGTTQRIALYSRVDPNGDVYVINPDGSGWMLLTTAVGTDYAPSWSPDGAGILFISFRDGGLGEIYRMNADGSGQTNLSNSPADDECCVSMSPDARKIAFASWRDGISHIYVMDLDDRGVTRLTSTPSHYGGLIWSLDGSQIFFHSDQTGVSQIYVMNNDGTAQSRLTSLAAGAGHPALSPDGTQIAFVSAQQIYVMNLQDRGLTLIPVDTGGALEQRPSWSPDGGKIAFDVFYADRYQVAVANADGSGQTLLTDNPGNNFNQIWSPAIRKTDANGLASVGFTLGNLAGTYRITATCMACSNIKAVEFIVNPNMPPTVDPPSVTPEPSNEGSPVTASASFHDPNGGDTFTCTVDYGDGSGPLPGSVSGLTCTGPAHTYQDNTTPSSTGYTVTVEVRDNHGGIGSRSATHVVRNRPPTVGPITVYVSGVPQAAPVIAVNTPITATAGFTDSGVRDTHAAAWHWGDGGASLCPPNTTSCTLTESNGSGVVTGSHTYLVAGVYTITSTVRDKDNDEGAATFRFVVVYDPSAGFVTGAGHIESPAGAYVANPALTGKAHFGFVSRYQRGANTPTGDAQFRMQAAGLRFTSTSYQWLVIAGPKAQIKGLGRIDGEGNYGFLLTATDGKVPGGGGADRFRIKIWDRDNHDAIVYDNQTGASEDAAATQAIQAGSITIHRN